MAFRSSIALAALSARALAQNYTTPTPETKVVCATGDVPEGARTITATQVFNGNGYSYINTVGACDANTLFKGAQATEWNAGASPATTPSVPSDASQWTLPSYSTEYVKVLVSTLYENGTMPTTPTSYPFLGATGTGSNSVSESTIEPSAPYGNDTASTTTQSSFNVISTSTPSGPCGGFEGSNLRGPNGETYEVRSGADSSANSYNGSDVANIRNCFGLCNAGSKCEGFTFVNSGEAAGICYLKSETGEFISGSNTVNMCSAFRVLSSANGTTDSFPSGSVVPTPDASGAPYQNSTAGNTVATGSSVPLNTAATGSSSASSNGHFQNSTVVDPASATSSASERTIVTTQTVTNTDVQTQTVTLGNGTTTAYLTATHTSEVPRTITVVGPVVTATHLVPVTEIITGHNETTTVVHTEKIPYTTTVNKDIHHTHTQNQTQVVTSVETKYLTLTKTGSNGTTTLVKTSLVPHTKTITPPVSYITRTKYELSTVMLPCTSKSCRKSATASTTSHKTTLVEPITASRTTIPAVVEVRTSTIRTMRSNSTITTTSCDTYTKPATTKWTYPVPCDTTSSSLRSSNSTTKISSTTLVSPNNSTRTSTTTLVSPNNSTRASTTPCDTTSLVTSASTINSANTTSFQRFTTSTIFTTSVKTISTQNSTSLETSTIVASTTLVPVPNTPVGPTTVPQTSAPASSPVAPGSQPSAPGSSPVSPVPQPSIPGSSPASPVAPDTTQTTHITTTSQKTVGVTVTETRPGESPVSPTQPEQPSSPVSPEQPSKPVSPEQPSSPVSPEQPSKPVSPEQPSAPVSPEQPSMPVSPEQPSVPVSPKQPSYPTEAPTPTIPSSRPTPPPAAGAAAEVNANIVAAGLVAVVAAVMMSL